MSKIITLRKGLDINLQGKAVEKLVKLPLAPEYAAVSYTHLTLPTKA